MDKVYYVYMTTNLINGKRYIGQHYGAVNDYYLGSGTILKRAIEKEGRENFKKEVLEICNDYTSMNLAERKWIAKFNAVESDEFYDIAEGGFNSNPCAGLTEEQEKERRKKLSEAAKGEKNYFYGKHFYGSACPMYGKHHTEEAKKIMSEKHSGDKAPNKRPINIYDLNGNFVQRFANLRDFKRFLGLSSKSSCQTVANYIASGKPYHGYILKDV